MRTFADYHREKMKDPAYKKEYDALEEWYLWRSPIIYRKK